MIHRGGGGEDSQRLDLPPRQTRGAGWPTDDRRSTTALANARGGRNIAVVQRRRQSVAVAVEAVIYARRRGDRWHVRGTLAALHWRWWWLIWDSVDILKPSLQDEDDPPFHVLNFSLAEWEEGSIQIVVRMVRFARRRRRPRQIES